MGADRLQALEDRLQVKVMTTVFPKEGGGYGR